MAQQRLGLPRACPAIPTAGRRRGRAGGAEVGGAVGRARIVLEMPVTTDALGHGAEGDHPPGVLVDCIANTVTSPSLLEGAARAGTAERTSERRPVAIIDGTAAAASARGVGQARSPCTRRRTAGSRVMNRRAATESRAGSNVTGDYRSGSRTTRARSRSRRHHPGKRGHVRRNHPPRRRCDPSPTRPRGSIRTAPASDGGPAKRCAGARRTRITAAPAQRRVAGHRRASAAVQAYTAPTSRSAASPYLAQRPLEMGARV